VKRIAFLVGLVLILAGCGVSVSTESSVEGPTLATVPEPVETTTPASTLPEPVATDFPVSVLTGAGEVVVEQRPEAIISLSPTATEMLFAVGAGDQVIAVDEYSTFPSAAPVTDLSGFTPNMEAIASYGPDLVIVSNDIDDIIATLGALDIQVLLMPAVTTIEGIFDQIDEIGIATGHRTEAAELIEGLSADFESAVAGLPVLDEPLTYYHELDPTFYSVTSSTFVGGVYGELGLENIADPADVDGFGYPQLSVEFIIEADPDLIFVTDCCGESLETVSSRAGWESLSAVQSGSVFVVDDDIASRWGPRTIEFLQSVADAVASAVSG
jgi:iron complex transport system substrate-binding protein